MRAGRRRPDLAGLELEIRTREEPSVRLEASIMPRVDAFASVGNSGNALANGSGDYSVGVAVTLRFSTRGAGSVDAGCHGGRGRRRPRRAATEPGSKSFTRMRTSSPRASNQRSTEKASTRPRRPPDHAQSLRDRHYDGDRSPSRGDSARSCASQPSQRALRLSGRLRGLLLATGELADVAPFAHEDIAMHT